jgi:formylglycine-generating enzyme required for sulfatase activity
VRNIFNFKVALFTKSINNILRLATLAAACLALQTHALAQLSCPSDLNDDGEVNSADVGLVLLDYGPCPAPTPSITLVNPSSGPTAGFTSITIFGTDFTGATSVTVGGVAATSIVVVSSTAITAISPAHSVGAVDIVVVTPNGTVTLAGAFTYFVSSSWYTILEQAPNATVVPDATVRATIVASGFPWRVRDNSSGIEMLLIPGGTFNMGCSASNSYGCNGNETNHQVTLSKAFYLGKTEVTQAQWQAKMSSNPSNFSGNANNPVEQVSWNDIAGFNTATGLRLPSEAEWEYACRGGTPTAFHSMPGYPNGTNDDSLLGNIAWYDLNSGYTTHAVAGKAANAFGMYDMSGNVFEWCNDWYGSYAASNATDPAGPSSGSNRVVRGGGWIGGSSYCRSSFRSGNDPVSRTDYIGFRAARTP